MPIRRPTNSGQPGFTANFVLGLAIVVLAFFTVLANISLYTKTSGLSDSDVVQRECIKTSFADLTKALQVRAEFGQQINQLRDKQLALLARGRDLNAAQINAIGAFSSLVLQPDVKEHMDEVRRAVKVLLKDTVTYRHQSTQLQVRVEKVRQDLAETVEQQNKTPIPPFPAGECVKNG